MSIEGPARIEGKGAGPDGAPEERQTASGIPLKPAYRAEDVPPGIEEALGGGPGEPPYIRGAYPGMYRSKPWRIFQLSGFGSPEDENRRVKFLLSHGETGFILEHDRMTADHLYDVDHPDVMARREDVGLFGSVTMSLRDFETILDGIPIERTYAHPGGAVVQFGPFAFACYCAIAQRRGIPLSQLSGTGQSDFFLTYLGCINREQIPPRAGLRLNCDLIEFCTKDLPHWVPVSIAGYNGADTGLNAYEEVGAVMANAVEYLDGVRARGQLRVEEFAHSVGGINLRCTADIFEEAAKLRVARKVWHDLLRQRYGVTDERSLRLRIHVVTAGSIMTYQQPLNNIVRGTLAALAAVLGGTQSLGVSGYDEAISIPSDHAHLMSLRIQHILQNECNLTAVADPLAGSYYVESLCGEIEERAWAFFEEIQDRGGFIEALDSGWLHERAYKHQIEREDAIASGRQKVVGVNCFQEGVDHMEVQGFEGAPDAWEKAMARLKELRHTRDQRLHAAALRELEGACRSQENLVPAVIGAVQADATVGEIGDIFREVFGVWTVPIRF